LWIVQDWVTEHGTDIARKICLGSNRRPGVFLQPNPLKTTPQALLDRLIQFGMDCRMTSEGQIHLHPGHRVNDLPGFEEGWFHVLDPSSRKPIKLLDPQAGETILDLCAAPGGKTALMAEHMQNRGTIYATDADPQRLALVRENCQRLGVEIVKIYREPSELPKGILFDAVLADVPCSNSGVMARRCEVRYRITPQAVKNLTHVQYAILEKAASMVRPGGRIVYSTCSILTEESHRLIERFLDYHSDFSLARDLLTLPHPDSSEMNETDGGFAALLIRR
jgi:16S rRNA (cytosine967-C5)-methyltransferase